METIIVESCHSTWIIDLGRTRFRRILKDVEVGRRAVSTEWRPYSQIHFAPDGETFTVILTPDGSRRIQSWRHTADCVECGGRVTRELSLDALREAVGT